MGVETALIATTLVGTATTAVGQIKQGRAAKKAAEYNAQVSEKNARQALEKARRDEKLLRINAQKNIGANRAARGAAGIRAEGSFQDIIAENFANMEADAEAIRQQGAQQAEAFMEEGRLSTMRGESAAAASRFGAAGTLLQGGATALSYGLRRGS